MFPSRLRFGAFVLLLGGLVAACDDATVSELGPSEVRVAIADAADPVAALKPYAGTRVRWSGTVVAVEKSYEDDFVEVARVLVDLDQAAAGAGVADVAFGIKPSAAGALQPGESVTFVGKIRELDRSTTPPLILMEAEIEKPAARSS